MQTKNPANLPSISVFSLYKYLFIRIFWRWQPMFLWVASNFHGSFPSLQVSVPWKKWLKHVKTCWGSKSQILHEGKIRLTISPVTLTWQEKLSITPICICMHFIFHMFAVDVLDFLLPSCLTGGLWVSATVYHLWNGWYCNNRTAKMESSSVQSPQSFPLNVF